MGIHAAMRLTNIESSFIHVIFTAIVPEAYPVKAKMCIKPHSHRAHRRASTLVDASNQTNVKDRKHSHRPRRRASTNLHTSNERCQFKLYIGYWTSNNNKWPKCSCQTPPDNTCANDVIDNAMT